MEITGRELLALALDLIDTPDDGSGADLENLERLAAHSVLALDSLNTQPETAVGGVIHVTVPVPAGRTEFTWGPGGDVTRPLPTAMSAWAVQKPDEEDTRLYRSTRLWSTEEWAAYTGLDQDSEYPYGIYWPKTLDDAGRYTFHIWPRTSTAVNVHLWMTVPKLDRIELDETYQLDAGRGQYLQATLAVAFAPVLGLPVHPSVYDILRNATGRLGEFSREKEVQHIPSTRYYDFTGNFRYNINYD